MRLLGHAIERQPLRYWLGRVFANTASLALGVSVFDTQCGAEAVSRHARGWPSCSPSRFCTRWIFDVEMLARIEAGPPPGACVAACRRSIYELPLDSWRDVAGSSVKGGDFVKAIGELASIYWTYLRPGARGWVSTPAKLPAVPGHDERRPKAA